GIPQIENIDNGHDGSAEAGAIDPELFGNLTRFPAVNEHRGRVGMIVLEAACLGDRLSQGQTPGAERKLALRSGSAHREEGLRLREDVDRILRSNVDVVGRIIEKRSKRRSSMPTFALARHPGIAAWI